MGQVSESLAMRACQGTESYGTANKHQPCVTRSPRGELLAKQKTREHVRVPSHATNSGIPKVSQVHFYGPRDPDRAGRGLRLVPLCCPGSGRPRIRPQGRVRTSGHPFGWYLVCVLSAARARWSCWRTRSRTKTTTPASSPQVYCTIPSLSPLSYHARPSLTLQG